MTNNNISRSTVLQGAVALAATGSLPALAQSSLERARILCGFPLGSTSDAMSRRVAEKLRGTCANNVVVDNKPGAGGQIAITTLRDSSTDGSNLLLTPSSCTSIYPCTALSQPDLITSMAELGTEVQSSSPQALVDLMKADAEEWRRLIKQIGFTAES